MMRNISRLALSAALLVAALPAAASAQMQFVLYGSGEWDTHEQSVYTLGLGAQTTNLGLGFAGNVLGYIVDQPIGSSIRAINPSAGIQYRWMQSALQVRAGYVFVDNDAGDTILGINTFGGASDGVTTAAQYNYWGTGERTAEVIGNMNWGDEYLWARARANQRILHTQSGGLNLGAEVVGQGNSDSKVFQLGPTAELTLGALKLIGVVGYKFRDDAFEDGPYFKAEFVLVH
jgi:hypothetical protein